MIRLVIRLAFFAVIAMAVGGVCRVASAQEAVAPPGTVQILSATAYWQLYDRESPNIGILVRYDIDYPEEELPEQSLDQIAAIHLSYTNGGQRESIMAAQPYPYNRRGYGEGLVAFFVPDQPGLTSSTPLQVSVFFFPGLVVAAPSVSLPVVWRPSSQYASDLTEQVRMVEVSEHWTDIRLLDADNHLTSDGIVYVGNVVPYLSEVAPQIFKSRLYFPEVNRQAVGDSYAQELVKPDGAEFWRTQFDPLADWIGQPVIMVKTLATIIIGLIAAWFFQRIAKSQLVSLPVLSLTLAGGALVGWVHMGFIGILGFAALLVFVFVTVLKRAS